MRFFVVAGLLLMYGPTSSKAADDPFGVAYSIRNPILFRTFYEQSSKKQQLSGLIDGPCHEAYLWYIDTSNRTCPQVRGGSCKAIAVMDCLLENIETSDEIDYDTAHILLGLIPTLLSLIGSTTTEVSLIALRRPFFAILIVACSPAIYPLRPTDPNMGNPVLILKAIRQAPSPFPRPVGWLKWLTLAIQYVLALGAIANVASMLVEMTFRSPSGLSLDQTFLLYTWSLLAYLPHLFGVLYVNYRVWLRETPDLKSPKRSWKQRLQDEFRPCAVGTFLYGRLRDGQLALSFALFFEWMASCVVVAHVFYGTTVMGAAQLIPSGVAPGLALRLLLSTLIARLLVLYELRGMSETTELEQSSD